MLNRRVTGEGFRLPYIRPCIISGNNPQLGAEEKRDY